MKRRYAQYWSSYCLLCPSLDFWSNNTSRGEMVPSVTGVLLLANLEINHRLTVHIFRILSALAFLADSIEAEAQAHNDAFGELRLSAQRSCAVTTLTRSKQEAYNVRHRRNYEHNFP